MGRWAVSQKYTLIQRCHRRKKNEKSKKKLIRHYNEKFEMRQKETTSIRFKMNLPHCKNECVQM